MPLLDYCSKVTDDDGDLIRSFKNKYVKICTRPFEPSLDLKKKLEESPKTFDFHDDVMIALRQELG